LVEGPPSHLLRGRRYTGEAKNQNVQGHCDGETSHTT
jgi:hypothetical protein